MFTSRAIGLVLASFVHAFGAIIDPVGRYELRSADVSGKAVSVTVTIAKNGEAFGGTLTSASVGTRTLSAVVVADSTITFTIPATDETVATVRMVVSGNSVTGEWSIGENAIKLTGRRVVDAPAPPVRRSVPAPNLAGHWSFSAASGTGNIRDGELTIVSHAIRGYSGVWISPKADADSSNVRIRVEHGAVTIRVPTRSVPTRTGPTDRFVTIVALPQPDGTLKGRWYRESGASGQWVAARGI